jgi:RHS repeat-associated protein
MDARPSGGDDQQRIALVETRTQGNEPGVPQQLIRYQFGNHLGSASLELDEQAQIISYEEYFPYGSTAYQAVRSQTETPKRYRFTGKERDEESGLYYHGARYYAAWLGRWVSCDPEYLVDGANLYQYAISDPIRYTDPTGTQLFELGTADDPEVAGCAGGECYVNIRQSRLQELQRQARVQQQLDTGAAIASNPFSAIFWLIARLFTDDPNKQAAAAQLGVATFGVAAATSGVAQGRQQMRSVAPAQPQRPVSAEVRPTTAGRTASGGAPPSAGVARPHAPPAPAATPPPPAPPPRPQLDVLVVGAETSDEFAYARDVSARGGNVTVVNPIATAEARAYQRAGGNFVQGRVEQLPASARFNLIREDYPFPLGRLFTPSLQFVEARVGRLKPGGTWMVVTESSKFVQALEAAGRYLGASVTVHQIPQAHEATPQSTYPRETTRYVVTFTR